MLGIIQTYFISSFDSIGTSLVRYGDHDEARMRYDMSTRLAVNFLWTHSVWGHLNTDDVTQQRMAREAAVLDGGLVIVICNFATCSGFICALERNISKLILPLGSLIR